ncbi:unnamed protein product [Brassica oleracea]|uniref:Uncharacterized protein n=1 Tax=Brassica oleracea TaxID=3712 RepID=A0A3P6GF92_BRAOL|nr:unnamed protein product [Brassica oleracea]
MAAAAALPAKPNRLISTASVVLLHLPTKLESPFFPTRQLGWFSLVMDTCLSINQSVSRSRIDKVFPYYILLGNFFYIYLIPIRFQD